MDSQKSKAILNIDGKEIVAEEGMTILEAALANDIYIPHLCYHPHLKPFGGCRLCTVELANSSYAISCRSTVKNGLIVKTRSPEIDKARRVLVEMLFANHHTTCRGCRKARDCELLRIAAYVGLDRKERLPRLRWATEEFAMDTTNPFFDFDHNKCVLCGICVRTCAEIQGLDAINFAHRGYATKVSPLGNQPLVKSICESCGECVVRCPVGALVLKDIPRPVAEVKTICPYCGVGCGINLGVQEGKIVTARGDMNNPINKANLCVKGRFGWSFIFSRERLTSPLLKKRERLVEVSWAEALELVASRFTSSRGDSFALIASTKCTNEENYLAQKFARTVMRTNNVDNSARLCQTPTIIGLAEAFGTAEITSSIDKIEDAGCILLVGTNITQTHPVIGLKVRRAAKNGSRLIVVSPKETDLCRYADIWLRLYPGTDVALFMGMSQLIVTEELIDHSYIKEHTEGFEDFRKSLDDFSLGRVERITGIPREKIIEAARVFATVKPRAVVWSSGLTQHSHGTDNVLALLNLVLVTGKTLLYPLFGQNNAAGACDMGCLPDFYPGYQMVYDQKARAKLEVTWDTNLPVEPGLAFTELWQAIEEGKIKSLYLIGANPAVNIADSQKVMQALKKVEFLVVQDLFLTETAKFADVVLPAASCIEKDGTFTNIERRIQRVRKVIEPFGNSRPDWEIICELARRLGSKGFDFSHPSEIMFEIGQIALEYEGISYDRLEEGPQWPLFQPPKVKGKLSPMEYSGSAEVPDIEYPLVLTTDRNLYHQGTLSLKVDGLNILYNKDVVKINPKDAADFSVNDGQMVRVITRRGEISAEAKITDVVSPGIIAITFHFPKTSTNMLTNSALDRLAKIPETKVCAVKIVPEK